MAIFMLMHDFMSNKDNQTVWNKDRIFLCFLHNEGLSYFSELFSLTVDHDYGLLISIVMN